MPWNRIGPYPGFLYRQHFACFSCRKMVRKPSLEIMPLSSLKPTADGLLCPECKGPLYNMGKAFRPPRHDAIKQWREIEDFYQRGGRYPNGRW